MRSSEPRRSPGQPPTDHVRQMEVADGHGIRVAQGDQATMRAAVHGPTPVTARKRRYADVKGQTHGLFESPRDDCQAAQDVCTPALDPEAVKDIVGRSRNPFGRRWRPEAWQWAGGGLTQRADQEPPTPPRVPRRDLLFQGHDHRGLEHGVRSSDAQAGVAVDQIAHRG